MDRRSDRHEQEHAHTYVGTTSPDLDGDTGDRRMADTGGDRAERNLVEGGPTQAGGTIDESSRAADPGGVPSDR